VNRLPDASSPERETVPSIIPPSMGRVAWAAYTLALKGEIAEPWDQLTAEERAAWESAATAVCG
jgi:hypothetical protein